MNKIKAFFQNKSLIIKILITIGLLLLFRMGALIPIPGIGKVNLNDSLGNGGFMDIINMLGGGALTYASILSLGVSPYITASIIVQLLSADVVPSLARMKKEGEKGQVKMERVTRGLTIFLALLQGMALGFAFWNIGLIDQSTYGTNKWLSAFIVSIILLAGSMVSLFIADQITMHGVGNGVSLIIFVGIVAIMPAKIILAYSDFTSGSTGTSYLFGFTNFLIYLGVFLLIIYFVAWFNNSERRIPIQEASKFQNRSDLKTNYLPFKVNIAGVVPVVISSAIISLPLMILQFFNQDKIWVADLSLWLSLQHWFGISLFAILTFALTIFFAHIQFNAADIADNLKRNQVFIVGIRQGEDTEFYLRRTITNLGIFGGIFLSALVTLPYILVAIGMPDYLTLGGTSLIILVSIALELTKQINAHYHAGIYSNNLKTKINQKSFIDLDHQVYIEDDKKKEKDIIIW